MEGLFSMKRKPLKCEPPHFARATDPHLVRPICTISTGNIIAFSSPTELTDVDCDTWGGHVYVCDLDTPWDSHKVVSTTHPVSALEWDGEGKQLLVATTEGKVMVFGQKDYLINEWTQLYSHTFPGEHLLKAIFFHPGRRLALADKKPDAPIAERIQALRPAPTLKGFGGVACPGALVVSATGLVGAVVPAGTGAADSLRAHRDRVTHVALTHSNGAILIAASCVSAGGGACVRAVRAAVTSRARAPRPAPAPAPALALTPLATLPCAAPPASLSWCAGEGGESLLLCGRSLALHRLAERGPRPAHPRFPHAAPPHLAPPAQVWQQVASWPVEGGPAVCVAGVRGPLGAGHAGLAVLVQPNALHLVSRDSHHYVCSRAVACGGAGPAAASPPKKAKYSDRSAASPETQASRDVGEAVLSCAEVSHLGGVLVAIDTHAQLHAFRLLPPDSPGGVGSQAAAATATMEYALAAGVDCLDALLALKPALLDALYERLTESFQRQPAAFQQYYYHSWLKLRIALCRLIPTAMCTVSWLTCLQTLWGLWAAVQAALRPTDAAPLTDDMDSDKVLLSLESKGDGWWEASTLSALRRPLARALDIAATALAAAADTPAHRHHGYELWADPAAIGLLRKLAACARAGGLPDAALARLLARLHQPAKPELVEECGAVSAARGGRVWEVHARAALDVAHLAAPLAPRPLQLEYGAAPAALVWAPEPPPAALSDCTPTAAMDSIRYMYLGMCGRWRACGRCGSRALHAAHAARHPAQRAHDARWLPHCRCGGRWTLVSIV